MLLFQLERLEPWTTDGMRVFFEDLPETDHKDGKFRLRRYSVIKPVHTGHLLPMQYQQLDITSFNQSSDYNDFQGDLDREFSPIDEEMLSDQGFVSICNLFYHQFNIPPNHPVEIHQMRVLPKKGSNLSPEGIHQDGFDHIAMIGVTRKNITGGNLQLFRDKEGDPVLDMPLLDSDIAFVDDKGMWHNGTPIRKVDKKDEGFMDFMVILADLSKDYTKQEEQDE